MSESPSPPPVLLSRISAALNNTKPFVASKAFVGPDRRVRNQGPGGGVAERRRESLALDD